MFSDELQLRQVGESLENAGDELDDYIYATLDPEIGLKNLGFECAADRWRRCWSKKLRDDEDGERWYSVVIIPGADEAFYRDLKWNGSTWKVISFQYVPINKLREYVLKQLRQVGESSEVMENADDELDDYIYATLDPEIVLKNLGFECHSDCSWQQCWSKKLRDDEDGERWHSVITTPGVDDALYRDVRWNGHKWEVISFQHVPINKLREYALKQMKQTHESLEVIHALLDSDPDAFDPAAQLDRVFPRRCPECGSSNVSNEDDEGLLDCFNCGIWFDPLHPDNSPVKKRMESADEISDLDAYVLNYGRDRRIRISYERTTPESAERGDVSDTGWLDEKGKSMEPDAFDREDGLTATDLAARFLYDKGACEASASMFYPGIWYSGNYHVVDYRTGEEEQLNFHLVNFEADEQHEVYDKLQTLLKRR